MKVVLCLLVLVAAAYAAPKELTDVEKRVFLDSLGLSHLFNLDTLKSTFCGIVALGGSSDTETQCESLCHQVLSGETVAQNLLHSGCPLICNSFQSLIHLIPCDKILGVTPSA
ncbi:uncharacterized protein LOC112566481 isoform X3 [Pomacea canaliculata]|uniref:uncharacterized protein LOC112566481 isoform X3 n=1 Tax=Pomacea canaliculata TaxID=400727 RepID=UPI000D73568C|nr:uncharacterized protein LOC112566481 isoform X3 [Pomacea canaliculata]XP_025098479.1 uncharacterized protein LOC112566481 isoform X3 [Pomacea canaliculata]